MTIKLVSASSLKVGHYIVIEGVACRVSNIQVSRPGKHGHAKSRIDAMGLIDNKRRVIMMPGHDNIQVPVIEKKTATVLSVHEGSANVMDSESYETFDLKIPEELKGQVTEGVSVLYWIILNDKIMKQVK